jgi:hypothetical protein
VRVTGPRVNALEGWVRLVALSAALAGFAGAASGGCTYDFDGAFVGSDGGGTTTVGGSGGDGGGGAATGGTTTSGGGGQTGGDGGAGATSTGGGGAGGVGGAAGGGGATSSSSSSATGTVSDMLACDGTSCPIGGNNACCWDEYQGHSAPWGECIDEAPGGTGCRTAANANNGLETRIECQYPSQCPGEVCCAQLNTSVGGQPFYPVVSCQATCGGVNATLCDPIAPACGAGEDCIQSSLLPPGYTVCAL